MDNISIKLYVLFEDPFWIGIFEQEEKEIYKVCKVTFGAEPKEGDVLDYILKEFYKLNFSSSKVENKKIIEKKENPKKLQREINKELKKKTIGTKKKTSASKKNSTKSSSVKSNTKKNNSKKASTTKSKTFFISKPLINYIQ